MLPFYWGFERVRGQLCALISGTVAPQFREELARGVRHIPLFLMRTWLPLCLEERLKMLGGCLRVPETQQSLAQRTKAEMKKENTA